MLLKSNRCIAAKVNHELVPLRNKLKNGDHIEIVMAAHARPNPSWLAFVTTGKARSQIRHFLRTMRFDESVHLGERLLNQAFSALHQPLHVNDDIWEKFLRESGEKSRDSILAAIGLGQKLGVVIAKRLLQLAGTWSEDGRQGKKPMSVSIRGTEGMAIQFARCCNPIPGDPILGFVKKDQGLVVHTHDCPQVSKGRIDAEKLIDVDWDPEVARLFDVPVKVLAENERGTLAALAAAIAEAEADISAVTMGDTVESHERYLSVQFTLQVNNRQHLAKVLKNLRRLPAVYRLQRVRA